MTFSFDGASIPYFSGSPRPRTPTGSRSSSPVIAYSNPADNPRRSADRHTRSLERISTNLPSRLKRSTSPWSQYVKAPKPNFYDTNELARFETLMSLHRPDSFSLVSGQVRNEAALLQTPFGTPAFDEIKSTVFSQSFDNEAQWSRLTPKQRAWIQNNAAYYVRPVSFPLAQSSHTDAMRLYADSKLAVHSEPNSEASSRSSTPELMQDERNPLDVGTSYHSPPDFRDAQVRQAYNERISKTNKGLIPKIEAAIKEECFKQKLNPNDDNKAVNDVKFNIYAKSWWQRKAVNGLSSTQKDSLKDQLGLIGNFGQMSFHERYDQTMAALQNIHPEQKLPVEDHRSFPITIAKELSLDDVQPAVKKGKTTATNLLTVDGLLHLPVKPQAHDATSYKSWLVANDPERLEELHRITEGSFQPGEYDVNDYSTRYHNVLNQDFERESHFHALNHHSQTSHKEPNQIEPQSAAIFNIGELPNVKLPQRPKSRETGPALVDESQQVSKKRDFSQATQPSISKSIYDGTRSTQSLPENTFGGRYYPGNVARLLRRYGALEFNKAEEAGQEITLRFKKDIQNKIHDQYTEWTEGLTKLSARDRALFHRLDVEKTHESAEQHHVYLMDVYNRIKNTPTIEKDRLLTLPSHITIRPDVDGGWKRIATSATEETKVRDEARRDTESARARIKATWANLPLGQQGILKYLHAMEHRIAERSNPSITPQQSENIQAKVIGIHKKHEDNLSNLNKVDQAVFHQVKKHFPEFQSIDDYDQFHSRLFDFIRASDEFDKRAINVNPLPSDAKIAIDKNGQLIVSSQSDPERIGLFESQANINERWSLLSLGVQSLLRMFLARKLEEPTYSSHNTNKVRDNVKAKVLRVYEKHRDKQKTLSPLESAFYFRSIRPKFESLDHYDEYHSDVWDAISKTSDSKKLLLLNDLPEGSSYTLSNDGQWIANSADGAQLNLASVLSSQSTSSDHYIAGARNLSTQRGQLVFYNRLPEHQQRLCDLAFALKKSEMQNQRNQPWTDRDSDRAWETVLNHQYERNSEHSRLEKEHKLAKMAVAWVNRKTQNIQAKTEGELHDKKMEAYREVWNKNREQLAKELDEMKAA